MSLPNVIEIKKHLQVTAVLAQLLSGKRHFYFEELDAGLIYF